MRVTSCAELLDEVLSAEPFVLTVDPFKGKQLVLYGAGRLGRMSARILKSSGLEVDFFIDKRADEIHRVDGYPVFPLDRLRELNANKHLLLLSALTSSYCAITSEISVLTDLPVHTVYDLLYNLPGAHFSNGWYAGALSDEDKAGIRMVFESLADEQSKRTYLDFLKWRISRGEWVWAAENIIAEEDKYFNPLTSVAISRKGMIVDGGAFDLSFGRKALAVNPKGAVVAFEPDHESYERCREFLSSTSAGTIALEKSALSDREGHVSFLHGHGLASRVVGPGGVGGDGTVAVTTLDSYFSKVSPNAPVVAIKLHIEGEELNALRGSRGLIEAYHPILLVNCSHNRDGLWPIQSFCASCAGYELFMRRHAFCGEGLTFYAIPK